MNEQEVTRLVDEIDSADVPQLWWDSELLSRASRVRDVRVVRALALCHHGLSNKEAFSAHVVRNAIKTIDAPDFALSWSIIDSEKDAGQLVQQLESFSYAPWAVAFVLGEIGGAGALRGAAVRLGSEHSARHYMIVRIMSHLLIRYLKIQSPKPVTMTMIDLKTGETTRGIPVGEDSPQQKMEMVRRSQADELFTPLEPSLTQEIQTRLARITDELLNCTRDQFDALLDRVPKRLADPARKISPQSASENLYEKGDVIGGEYEVLAMLGKGGFGVVYLVQDLKTHHAYALKTFRDEFLADADARDAFRKESLLWVNLEEHPFILEAQWVQAFSGRLFVAMDYVESDAAGRGNLSDHLQCGEPLALDQVVEWAIQFCLGMEHANARGVKCHRDIKPANILIAQGVLKITDFGLAAVADTAAKSIVGHSTSLMTEGQAESFRFSVLRTEGGIRCGTPGYMPPEVYRGEPADVRSDVHSFGLVLWQMAMNSPSPPFVSAFRGDMEAYMREAYERQISGRIPPVAQPLRSVVECCLNPLPSKRYSNFGELRHALEPIFQKLTGKAFTIPSAGEETARFWNNKGMSLAALGRREEAVVCYDKALVIEAGEAKIWSNKGFALQELNRHREALECYDKALTIAPQLDGVWSNKGSCLDALGWREKALECYDNALVTDFRNAKTWNNKGKALNSLGRNAEAIDCYDEALAIEPRYAEAWNNKGASLDALGGHEEAIRHYEKALAIDPRDASAWYNKGSSLATLGQREMAIGCYDMALAVNPQDATVWYNKGNALDALVRNEEAIECYDKSLAIDPRLDEVWNNKGGTLVALARYEEAIFCYDKALAITPRDATRWFNKAFSEDEFGRAAAAVRSYTRFLELAEPQHAKQITYAKQRIKELENR